MKDTAQAEAIEKSLRETAIVYATIAVSEARHNLQKAELDLDALLRTP